MTAATVVMSAADSETSPMETDILEPISNLSPKEREVLIAAAENLAKTAKSDYPDASDKESMEFGMMDSHRISAVRKRAVDSVFVSSKAKPVENGPDTK